MVVSVIIPAFNAEKTIEKTILSVIYLDEVSEVIVINDGSKDYTSEIIKRLSNEYKKIKVLEHPNKENKGAPASRNLGLKYAKNEWIQFLDSDDTISEVKLKNQINLVNEGLSLIIGNSINFLENGNSFKNKSCKKIWLGLLISRSGITSSNLWKKQEIVNAGGWNEKLNSSQEYDLMFRILKNNENVRFDNSFETFIFWNPDSISHDIKKEEIRVRNWIQLRTEIKNYLISKNQFSLFLEFHYSGKIGYLKKRFPQYVQTNYNEFFFQLYRVFHRSKKIFNIN